MFHPEAFIGHDIESIQDGADLAEPGCACACACSGAGSGSGSGGGGDEQLQ